ncbi:carbohydrate porin [Rhodopirellula sp. SWK7]|uniref:carbohydrate porin n=1 Tax=Rhodopirellula sp. SWK7 TaxID=595460 RepID=UPI0002BE4717|nr:carbohydrate porin [Rhodopirellula sp. SWK7]EMI46910.1 Carbohydrate-selective porin OprB [Rhodopirellula sp. SWK7]
MTNAPVIRCAAVVIAAGLSAVGFLSAKANEDVFCDEGTACDVAPIEEVICAREYLSGDWCGVRPCLKDSGITPFLYYDSIAAANVDGGITADQDFAGQIYAGADLDLETLLGWDSTTLKISTVERHGDSISRSVGGIYDPMCIYGGQVGYLYQFFLEKTHDEQLAVKFGRVSADTDFANYPLYRYSLSTAINGPIRATLLENTITSFPYPVWGGRVKYTPSDKNQFQLGVYQIGDRMWDFTQHGLDFSIRSDDGVSLLMQHDWTSTIRGCKTRLAVGTINSFFEFDDFDSVGTTDFVLRIYGHVDVEVARNLTVFCFASNSEQDEVANTPVQISCGINGKGMCAGRADDHTMFFATYGELSDDYGDSFGEAVDHEIVYELGHRFQLVPAAYVQPALQYIVNPSGTGNIANRTVLGAWGGAPF